MVCDIPVGDGKIANLFLQCTYKYFAWLDHIDRCRRPCCRPRRPRPCPRTFTTSPWTLSRRRCSSEALRPQTVSGRHYTDKKENQISSYLRKFRMEQLQSRIWLRASSYMGKYFRISSYTYQEALPHIWVMTLQLLHSEFPYIWGKFNFFFISAVLPTFGKIFRPFWAFGERENSSEFRSVKQK